MGKANSKSFASLKRTEDKYVVTKDQAKRIEDEVSKYWGPAYPNKNTKYVNIKSTYFDSPKADFYQDHLNQKNHRIKIRLRNYAPDGNFDPKNFLEVKSKDDGVITKQRIEIDRENRDNFLKGQEIVLNTALDSLNSKLLTADQIESYVNAINSGMKEYKLVPILSTFYRRCAYGRGNSRVTIDENLTFKNEKGLSDKDIRKIIDEIDIDCAQEMHDKYDPQTDAIVEVKYDKDYPDWLDALLKGMNLEPTRMAKYVWSMYPLLTKQDSQNAAMFVIASMVRR